MDNIDPRIPALQLLLGDATPEMKRKLVHEAFGNELFILIGDAKEIRRQLRTAKEDLEYTARNLDGSSPIGRSGQENIRDKLSFCHRILTTLEKIIP